MDTTEQRAGFRLPWSDRRDPPAPEGGGDPPMETEAADMAHDGEMAPDAGMPAVDTELEAPDPGTPEAGGADGAAVETPVVRRTSRFLAELTRAMHAAAEEGRVATLDQLRADGKSAVEEIQSRSADDATTIRRRADDDVTGIREWSKSEIARIREETEQRIAGRKSDLDRELEGHAAIVEAEIENVQSQVAAFEAEMDAFFERLIAEEDPGRFAALAASLPEPPPFAPLTEAERAAVVARATGAAGEGARAAEPRAEDEQPSVEGTAEGDQAAFEGGESEVQAAVEDATEGMQPEAEQMAESAVEGDQAEGDPRLATTPDFADAERDALADVAAADADGSSVADGSISARLAGLAGGAPQPEPAVPEDGPAEVSQVVVTGLTSVSSIAAFKRQLGRLDGVRAVTVSSGPSGEFVFAVTHGAGVALADGVASLGGFSPQINRAEPGILELTAHDPEA